MPKNRLEAFSDAVFAIVITLLMLELRVPQVTAATLSSTLWAMWPKFAIYIVSFIIIGMYWVAHHSMVYYVRSVNRVFLWLNIALLLTVSFIPFPTALLGEYPTQSLGIVWYASNLLLVNGCGVILWAYATYDHRLVDPQLPATFIRWVIYVHAAPILFYLLAIGLARVDYRWSLGIFVLIPLLFILPNPIFNRYMEQQTPATPSSGDTAK